MNRFLVSLFFISLLFISWNNGFARSWDDLDAGEHDIYGSEREEKFPVKALFMEMENWENHYSFMFMWLFKYTDYPKYTSTRLLPLYYNLESKIDNRSMTIFPVLPLFFTYLERDGDEYTKHVLFPLYYSSVDRYEYDRAFLFLFWWGGSYPENYRDSSYQSLVPLLWFHWRDESKKGYGESVYINPLFFSYTGLNDGSVTEYTRWAPIIPLTFHSVDRNGGHRNFFWLIDYSWTSANDGDSLDRFWFIPLFMWGAGNNGYTYLLPPVYIYNKYYNGDYYCHLLPFFSAWEDSYGNTSNQIITPLFAKRKVTDKSSGEETYSNFFFPIIPLFFTSTDRTDGSHTNIAWLLDWERNNDGSMKTFWFAPLVFHESRDYGYRYYFPFYMRPGCSKNEGMSWSLLHFHEWSEQEESYWVWPYYQNNSSDGSWYYHLLPFFAAWKNNGAITEKQVITPLFSRRKVTEIKTGDNVYSNFFFPVIPLFFTSSDRAEGTHTNIAWLLDWEKDTEGDFRTFWLAPFIFHEFRDYGYRIYFPFYIRPGGMTRHDGFSFSLFHYHGWSDTNDTLWAWLYYHDVDYDNPGNDAGNYIPDRKVTEYYRHLLPVYWSWQNTESSGTLLLPLIFNYRDGYTKLHINLTGIAYKTFTGPFNPDLRVGLEHKENNWFLDTDISWLYDMFSISTRVPVTGRDGELKEKPGYTPGEISINKKSVRREDSQHYLGWDVLFGWMAYRHADSRYHWRILPLSWFTWDSESEDKTYMFLPFFLSYYSEQTKEGYFVVAPFYASQMEGESYKRGYLINLYWDEYTAEENCREKTVLWPFINWYYSPEKHGFRFFPLFWYANWKDGEETISRSISPLHYSMSITDSAGNYRYRKRLNPLYYLKESVGDTGSTYSFFAPVIPLYYYGESTETGTNGLSIEDTTSVSLFHIYTTTSVKNRTESSGTSTLLVPVIPLFYRGTADNYSHWNMLGLIDSCTGPDYSRFFVLPLFYTSTREKVKYRNILGFIDWETGGDSGGSSMVLPFYIWNGGDESSLTIPLLLSYFSSGKDTSTKFIAGTYWHSSPDYTHQDILLLYDHTWNRHNNREYDEYDFLLSTVEIDVSPDIWKMKMAWGALLKYSKNSRSGEYNFDALLGFAGFDNEHGGFHSRLIPLWYYQSYGNNDWWLVVPPLLSYFSESGSGDFDLALLGMLYYRNEDVYSGEDRRMVLLGTIYNEVKRPERKYHSRGSLWGLLWDYETEEERDFTKFTILKGLYKYVEHDGKSENTFFWFL